MSDVTNGKGSEADAAEAAERTATQAAKAASSRTAATGAGRNGHVDDSVASASIGVASAATGSKDADSHDPSPAAALRRHLDWLEFALEAAQSELGWREKRVAKATKRNQTKRTERLADVEAEVRELTALLTALRDLVSRAATPARPTRGGAARRPALAARIKGRRPTPPAG
jgi:hypothetical protein